MSPKTKKILSIVAVVLLGLIGLFAVYAIMVTPARQPYRDALTQYNRVEDGIADLNTAGSILNAGSATNENFDKNIQTAQNVLKNLTTEQKALGKEQVLTTGEGKALYDAFDKDMQVFITYNENILTSMQKVRPVIFGCTTIMSNISAAEESIAALRTCSTNLAAVQDVPDADYKELATTFSTKYGELATVLESIAALPDPKGADAAQNTTLEAQRDQILADISTASTTFSTNSKQHRAAIVTTDSAENLKNYLENNSRVIVM